MSAEEMLLLPCRDIHVVSEKQEPSYPVMQSEVQKLESAVGPEMNVTVSRRQTLTAAPADSLAPVFLGVLVLCPFLLAWMTQNLKVAVEPLRITGVEHVHEVTYPVRVTKTKDPDISSSVDRPKVLNIPLT
jgi:hypothetical protein